MNELNQNIAELLFPGGGELGQLIRSKNWDDTPLGAIDAWPQSLRTAVSIVLYSDFPMIVLWGTELVQIYNDGYRLLMGAKHPLGLGQPTRECWPETWEINRQIFPRILAGETVAYREAKYPLAPNGVVEDHYLTLSYSPVRDESGGIGGVLVTVFDVTTEVRTRHERDHALDQARAERERLYEVFMQAPAAIAVLEGDQHIFTVANPRYRELVGGRDVLGKPVADALPEIRGQGFVDLLDQVRNTGQPVLAHDAAVQLARANGRLENVYVDFVYQPLTDPDDRVFGIMVHAVETTEQVLLQRRLEVERNRLAEVFQEAPAAIAVTQGPEHVFITANATFRQLLTNSRAVDGLSVRQAFPELEGQGFFDLLDDVYTSGKPYVGRELLARYDRNGDGKPEDAYLNFVYQPLADADGAIGGIMIHAVEVTDQVLARRDMERRAAQLVQLTHDLEQSNRELDQFAYVASHDLKAPLRGIANLAEWIAEDVGANLSDESREHVRLLQGRVHRMEALIEGILAYSRAARVRTMPEPIDTGAMAHDVVELLAPTGDTRIDIAPDMPMIEAERVPLQQVFMNLISNAVKYTRVHREDVRVQVGWRPGRDTYEFFVSDNGPGIAPEYHERIWGIFQTLQARDKVEGTGIGLSVVKRIVESRGGSVWLESSAGAGATFHFTWPRYTPPPKAAQTGGSTTS